MQAAFSNKLVQSVCNKLIFMRIELVGEIVLETLFLIFKC